MGEEEEEERGGGMRDRALDRFDAVCVGCHVLSLCLCWSHDEHSLYATLLMIVLFIVLFQKQTTCTFGEPEGTYSITSARWSDSSTQAAYSI